MSTTQESTVGNLLTVEEAAALLKCSVSSLNKWRIMGLGPRLFGSPRAFATARSTSLNIWPDNFELRLRQRTPRPPEIQFDLDGIALPRPDELKGARTRRRGAP
jgi:hypothetical protein